jgi:hypothetical protein
MYKILSVLKYNLITVLVLFFICVSIDTNAQDTLAGDYNSLIIKSGFHVIKENVTIKGKLEIQPGAKIELSDPGLLICEGDVSIIGDKNNKIEIFGKPKYEGVGLVIRGLDNNNQSRIDIRNTVFSQLQLPILFDFGWKRSAVNIADNYFINNTGKVTIIQVLNPPFNLSIDFSKIDFKIEHNLFSGNNAAIYFEDFKSDHVNILIRNNTFYGNLIYGYKNYNISTNILYGRADAIFARYTPLIENNSFTFNYLIDNIADTIVHAANFGIYGTEKTIGLKNNYLGANKQQVLKGIYDQVINYNVPKIEFEPFLTKPNELNPAHIYAINNLNNTVLSDTIIITEPLKGFILKANSEVDYSKAILNYIYFKDDSSLKRVDTILTYDIQPNSLDAKILITKVLPGVNHLGYYSFKNIIDKNADFVPEVKFGYISFLNELRKRSIIAESVKNKLLLDSLKNTVIPKDSLTIKSKNEKVRFKSKIEFGLLSGGSIFLGTISKKGIPFGNDINLLMGANINIMLTSNFSMGLNVESFKLSNSDATSNNNEQLARGMSFVTTMQSISPYLNYDFVDNRSYSKGNKIKPSIGLGFDIVSFNPTGVYNGTVYNLQELGTGGQFADSTKVPYAKLTFGYSLNFKLKYQFNKFNSIGLHMAYHISMSNYLDDVGADAYPTIAAIKKSKISDQFKDAAIYFSNPTSRNVVGQYRNNPDGATDSYLNFGIFYSRKLFK